MSRLVWKTHNLLSVAGYQIPCSEYPLDEGIWQAGIRRDSPRSLRFKSLVWPAVQIRDDLLVDGFVQRVVGTWLREFTEPGTSFLDVGCGAMNLSRYVARKTCYNAFDRSISEFHLRRLMHRVPDSNVAVASVTDIPLESNVVSLLASTQVLEYVQRIDRAAQEIRRVACPGAKFACTIGNDYARKYETLGPHRGHVNHWTYQGFIEFMGKHGFRLLRSQMRGVWIPIGLTRSHTSYAFPTSARDEADNTHFLYLFEVVK